MIALIYNSPEAAADRAAKGVAASTNAPGQIALVTSLYQTILGRTPETAGLSGFLAELNNGTSPATVASQIYASPEAVADRASVTPPAAPTSLEKVGLVTSLYQTILGRTPEVAGLNAFLAELAGGTSVSTVAARLTALPKPSQTRRRRPSPRRDRTPSSLRSIRPSWAGPREPMI